ncbi:MAG: YbjN domain-containing protein [Candidatus Limnocylindria bacterium]
MPSADPGAVTVATDRHLRPADVERQFADLGLHPLERADRDGITSWDLILDGRRRYDLRVTVILDPAFALICWAHFAPPINDLPRKAYRRLLRWNDDFPFVKFAITEDERPLLITELPVATIGPDDLGRALARTVAIADRLFDESTGWLWFGGRVPDQSARTCRNEALLARHADVVAEIAGDATG